MFGQNGKLLYVGETNNPLSRLGSHWATAAWWAEGETITVEPCDTREQAKIAEYFAIITEHPAHNRRYSSHVHEYEEGKWANIFWLPWNLLRELKILAEERGVTVPELANIALNEWYETRQTAKESAV